VCIPAIIEKNYSEIIANVVGIYAAWKPPIAWKKLVSEMIYYTSETLNPTHHAAWERLDFSGI